MARTKGYKVCVNDVPALYGPTYFPRTTYYKNDAIKMAQRAIAAGASFARVECPNGGELDFRPPAPAEIDTPAPLPPKSKCKPDMTNATLAQAAEQARHYPHGSVLHAHAMTRINHLFREANEGHGPGWFVSPNESALDVLWGWVNKQLAPEPAPCEGRPHREVENTYFKDFGDGRSYMSGLSIPKDPDGVCRDYHFINCDFHAGCAVPWEHCTFTECDGMPGPKWDGPPCPVNEFQGLPVYIGKTHNTIFISLPYHLAAPIAGGCDCDYCKAHPDLVPRWDTINLAPGHGSTGTVHFPDIAKSDAVVRMDNTTPRK